MPRGAGTEAVQHKRVMNTHGASPTRTNVSCESSMEDHEPAPMWQYRSHFPVSAAAAAAPSFCVATAILELPSGYITRGYNAGRYISMRSPEVMSSDFCAAPGSLSTLPVAARHVQLRLSLWTTPDPRLTESQRSGCHYVHVGQRHLWYLDENRTSFCEVWEAVSVHWMHLLHVLGCLKHGSALY